MTPEPEKRHRRSKDHRGRPVKLRLSRSLSKRGRGPIAAAIAGLPELTGSPIYFTARPQLSAHRGKLLSGRPGQGVAVHAGTFLKRREVVVETELLRRPRLLRMIVVHEIFHFVWARLGNPRRRQYAELLAEERRRGARGELGESAGIKKAERSPDYVCESFCDTAAWLYAGVGGKCEVTLAARWRKRREEWFNQTFARQRSC